MRPSAALPALCVLALGAVACTADQPPAAPEARLAIAIAPLSLDDLTDVTYTLSVRDALGATVWTRQIASSAYGDGDGAISYVGPCNAADGANPNTVLLTLDALETASGPLVAGVDYYTPTPAGASIAKTVHCEAMTDVPVVFDLTVLRAAQQGFFDMAIAFDDVFCSAKLDCERAGGADIELLFDPHTGERGRTVVLGFACTAGPDTPTFLHLDDVVVTCGDQDFVVDVAAGPGNLNPPFPGPPNTADLLFQAATYRGAEQLSSGGVDYTKAYWNVALGLNVAALPNLGACTLRTRGTATAEPLPAGQLPVDAFYPFIAWEVPLTDADGDRVCGLHGMQDESGVTPLYTDGLTPIAFGASYERATGLVTDHPVVFGQHFAGDDVVAGERFGLPLALGDFDGDGFTDLAVAALGEDAGAGAVSLFSASAAGLSPQGATFTALDLGGATEAGDGFGAALAPGDFNGDGFTDLAVAAPGANSGFGALWIIPGGPDGLRLADATPRPRLALPAPCGGTGAIGDDYGAALVAGDFDGDGFSDLAIGIPGDDADRGAVCVVAGHPDGLAGGSRATLLTRAAGAPGDRYGATLAAGRLDDDAHADLAVGAPGATAGAGLVEALRGQPTAALFASTRALLTQGTAGGLSESNDAFGAALATGDVDDDGVDELVIGAPGDRDGAAVSGGAYLFSSPFVTPTGTALTPSLYAPRDLHPDGAAFGAALAIADVDGDRFGDIIVGAPGVADGVGRLVILPGGAAGPRPGDAIEAQDAGLLVRGRDALGAALAAADVNGDGVADIVAGAPGASPSARPAGGQIVYLPGRLAAACPPLSCADGCGACERLSHVCVDGGCDFDYRHQAHSTFPMTLDGAFTAWDAVAPPPRYEWWDVTPVAAQLTDAYLTYDGQALWLMNDWFFNDALPLDDACYNLFVVTTDNGAKRWVVKLFAEGAPQVFLNGEPVDPAAVGVDGAYGFGPSPRHAADHSRFELRIPTGPGQFSAQFSDPGPDGPCDVLHTEPTVFVGRAHAGGGLDIAGNVDVPWLVGANGGGDEGWVMVSGVGLGDAGAATIGGQRAEVLSWSDTEVFLRVPAGAHGGGISLTTSWGRTNTLAFDPALGGYAVVNEACPEPHTVDGHLDVAGHEWRGVVPVATDRGPVYADHDGARLHLFYGGFDPADPRDVHLRGWTGGGSGYVGGPDHLLAQHDGAGVVQWDITITGGVVHVHRDGVLVGDPAGESIHVALGGGLELVLPAGAGGFGFELVTCEDRNVVETCEVHPEILHGVVDPKSGLYVRATADPTLLSLDPLAADVGALVTLAGANLGDGGQIALGAGALGDVVSWGPREITFIVPAGADTGFVRAVRADGAVSNGLWFGLTCSEDAGCPSGVCDASGACEMASCFDGVLNGDETDVDCGGGCGGCDPGGDCVVGADCASRICAAGVCTAPTCGDGVKNQGESDVDCGGPCAPCVAGKTCGGAGDCVSAICTLGVCQVATCFDGVQNQNETDLDCGGLCAPCAVGQTCAVAGDCAYGTCTGQTCVCTPQCSGKVCGPDGCGGTCGTCPGVQTCQGAGSVCDFVYTLAPKSNQAHVVDGAFTGWNADTPPTTYEWSDLPWKSGERSHLYLDYDGTRLHVMSDWFYNDVAPIDPECYALFIISAGDGDQRWQVKVFGDDTVQAFLNGTPVDPAATNVQGAVGFTESPRVTDRAHTLYELAIPAPVGKYTVQLHAPGPLESCDVLEREPVAFVGDTLSSGGLRVAHNPDVPWLAGANPSRGRADTLVQLYGVALGDTPGTALFGGQPAVIDRWRDDEVWLRVPAGASSAGVRLTTADGYATNDLRFGIIAEGAEPGAVLNARSRYPHTIDGLFTDWVDGSGARHEWDDITPASGQYTYAYFDYDGAFLYLLNDWKANPTAPMSAECFNHFMLFTGGGLEQWDIKVYGDQTVTAERNGVLVDPASNGVDGAATFGPSPLVAVDHTIFELKLPAEPGGWGLQLHDPGPTNPGTPDFTCEGNQLTEASNFRGILDAAGGNVVVPSTQPTIFGVRPQKAAPGEEVVFLGADLGATAGTVRFAPNVVAQVVSWSPTEVRAIVPDTAESGLAWLVLSGGAQTNGLLFRRICHTGDDCTSGVCVDESCQLPTCSDGVLNGAETGVDCGGPTCGKCGAGQGCAGAGDCVSGVCTGGTCALPGCSDGVKNGSETAVDCGGSCGGCAYGQACLVGADCASGTCSPAGLCRPSAAAVATSDPSPVGSFQLGVSVTVRVTDTGLSPVSALRVEAPDGWLIPSGAVTAHLADGTDVTGQLAIGAAGAGANGGRYYTLTGLNLAMGDWAELVFTDVQAQEQLGDSRWYTEVNEGAGYARVSPNPVVEVAGTIADGSGGGSVDTGGDVVAGDPDVTVTVGFVNDLYDYVSTSAAEIFNNWTSITYASESVNWALSGSGASQVLRTTNNTARPAYFISNDLLYDGIIEVNIGVKTTNDDDFMGMVFRWQDKGNFYLLDWKQAAQSGGGGTGRRGLVLRAVRNWDFSGDGVYPNTESQSSWLWNTNATRNDVLAYWNSGWADNRMYALKVILDGPRIRVYIDNVLRMDVTDYTYAGGRYGPYTFSQPYTSISNLRVFRDTITNETVQIEVPPGWPRPVVGAPPAGNLAATHQATSITSLLTVGPTGAGPNGGTVITATPLTVIPGDTVTLTFGPVQAPAFPGTETWWMYSAGVGGVLTPLSTSPQVTIVPAP